MLFCKVCISLTRGMSQKSWKFMPNTVSASQRGAALTPCRWSPLKCCVCMPNNIHTPVLYNVCAYEDKKCCRKSCSDGSGTVNGWDLIVPRDLFESRVAGWPPKAFNEGALFSLQRGVHHRTNREDRLLLTVPGNVIRISQFSVGTILSQDFRDIM